MFFSLTEYTKSNFTKHFVFDKINLYTDSGWISKKLNEYTLVYKGYADEFNLEENLSLIIKQKVPKFFGNFCVICYDHVSGKISIKTDVYRSFPIFVHDREITNLAKSEKIAWTDSIISVDQDFKIEEEKFDVIGEITTDKLSVNEAVTKILDILSVKTEKFLSHNRLPIRAHLSGGVDSLLVCSLLKNKTDDLEIIKSSHFDYDKFWLLNDTQIKMNFWGYKQIHHWIDPCILTSGAPGDEFMLRSPITVDMLLKYRDHSMLRLLETKTKSLHSEYFHRQKHTDIFKNQKVDRNLSTHDFYWKLCNIVMNDWQHWHIGNTLTWTPLRDLEIFKIFLRLDDSAAVGQIFDSEISIKLIEKNVPGMSKLISDQKNSQNPMKNLVDFLFDNTV
jgi:hypothetical protein